MVTQLREGVWWIDATGVNAYLLEHDGEVTLVDAGTPFDADRISAALDSLDRGPTDVDRILLTHYDVDHVGALDRFGPDTPIYIGRDDAGLLAGRARPERGSIKGLIQFVSRPFGSSVPTDRIRRVDDGDEIGGFVAYHAPGHTPGHTVYVHEARGAAFLGDLVVERGGDLRPSPWFLCTDHEEATESIGRVAERLPAFEVAAMGHGTPFERGGRDRLEDLAATL
jgi:glyoxylase-like metal-dependent hydrolase (beta-lactamase superfamily II)